MKSQRESKITSFGVTLGILSENVPRNVGECCALPHNCERMRYFWTRGRCRRRGVFVDVSLLFFKKLQTRSERNFEPCLAATASLHAFIERCCDTELHTNQKHVPIYFCNLVANEAINIYMNCNDNTILKWSITGELSGVNGKLTGRKNSSQRETWKSVDGKVAELSMNLTRLSIGSCSQCFLSFLIESHDHSNAVPTQLSRVKKIVFSFVALTHSRISTEMWTKNWQYSTTHVRSNSCWTQNTFR